MNLIEICIRRPAFTIVLSLIITVLGLIGYSRLPIRWIPDVNPPVVSIRTVYAGASANLVESQITTPIETSLAGIEGVDTIDSSSREGESYISLNFNLGTNLNNAMEDVRSALQYVNGNLPLGAKQPTIGKADTANNIPILFLAFSDAQRNDKELSDYVKQFVLPRLQIVDGVASVVTYGQRESAMHIWLDPMKMASSNVTVDDINKVISEQNVEVPSGQIRSPARFYSVVTNESLNSPEEFNNLIIRRDQNQMVRIKDVGQAMVDAASADTAFRVQGHPAVALGIIPQSNANPLEVARNIKKEFSAIKKSLPSGMQGNVVFDQSIYIESSVHDVYQSLIEAIILVLIVIFLFLANWRAALIPIVTIPVCLIGTFALMSILGFSINTITLMAFVLAIGLVVDDAIVMLENIMRYIESGMSALTASLKGGREIIFPIVAMTLTLAVVYTPIAMTSGILHSIFKEFALTLTLTVIISGFVALTLSPMMCSRFLKDSHSDQENRFSLGVKKLRDNYKIWLSKILEKKRWIILGLIGVGVLGYMTFQSLPTELAPKEDMNEVDVYVSAPRNASFQYTDSYVQQLEKIYQKVPGLDSYLTDIGSSGAAHAFQLINLVPRNHRNLSAMDIADNLNEQVKNLPGIDAYVFPAASPLAWSSGSEGANISLQIMSSSDYKDLHQVTQQMIAAIQKSKTFSRVDSQLKWDGEQFELNIDREKVADTNTSMQNITNTISTMLAGRNVGYYEYGGNQYDVILKMNQVNLLNPNIISQLYVRNNNNTMLPLSDLVTMKETTSPEMLPHFERMRSDTLFVSLAPGFTIADGVNGLQKIAKSVLPDNAKFAFSGEARNFLESNGKMSTTFLLAIIFIYLILVAQFESFIDPLVILLTVPFAMIGGLLLLKLAGGSLNIYSDIGLVTLIGLIAKHGILITEFANRQRLLGKNIDDAVVDAAVARFRPILMTTAAMVLGALPLALALGPGSETRHQIGWVIVGGLVLGTFFSLVVVPVAYSYLARFKKNIVQDEAVLIENL